MERKNLYDFVYRGILTEEALDRNGRKGKYASSLPSKQISEALNFDLLDQDELENALKMAQVFTATTTFERMSRKFIAKILQGEHDEGWWNECVSDKIRRFAENRRAEENSIKWHGTRGEDPLTYVEMGHLSDIIQQNWLDFQPYLRSAEWASSIFETIERSRNVIMHSGTLEIEDIERVGMNIRDWIKQVGS